MSDRGRKRKKVRGTNIITHMQVCLSVSKCLCLCAIPLDNITPHNLVNQLINSI